MFDCLVTHLTTIPQLNTEQDMNLHAIAVSSLMTLATVSASASDFLSTEPCDHLFNIGLRAGVNSSNRTFSSDHFQAWNVNSWGTGFDAGVVLNLNLRDYLAIQPGFFFESRSGNYAYSENFINIKNEDDNFTQLGHLRSYNFIVPVMASLRFNVADNLRWIVEAGPYAQFKLHSSDSDKIQVIDQPSPQSPLKVFYAKSRFADFGLKIGTGLTLNHHYYFGIHYMAGGTKVWKEPEGGLNKAWTFTIGYDF